MASASGPGGWLPEQNAGRLLFNFDVVGSVAFEGGVDDVSFFQQWYH
jgi:hypothetical protein